MDWEMENAEIQRFRLQSNVMLVVDYFISILRYSIVKRNMKSYNDIIDATHKHNISINVET